MSLKKFEDRECVIIRSYFFLGNGFLKKMREHNKKKHSKTLKRARERLLLKNELSTINAWTG